MGKEKTKSYHILTVGVFILLTVGLFIMNLTLKKPDILLSERRVPEKLPELSYSSVTTGSFMRKFENYATDNFSKRDSFRTVKSFTIFDIYFMEDKDGLYRKGSVAGEFKYMDEKAIVETIRKISRVADSIDGTNIYYSIVPDKSNYLDEYLFSFDMKRVENLLHDSLDRYTYIPIEDYLSFDSYYKTDIHWNQSRIENVAIEIGKAMGAEVDLTDYKLEYAGDFYGIYKGQLALPMEADRMEYLSSTNLTAAVFNPETMEYEECPVYDLGPNGFSNPDPYSIFLEGVTALVTIENNTLPERELYLFRDSYGSSIAPLLAGGYSKITLIDLRYIDARALNQVLEFDEYSDILFLYSAQILNNPSLLKA